MLRVSVSAATALLLLAVPAVAHADPPICPQGEFVMLPNRVLNLPAPQCQDPEGKTYQVSSFTQGAHGTVAGSPTGATYTPQAGFHGRDQFTYRVTDADGEISAPATVRILVDTPPDCSDSTATVRAGETTALPDFPCDDAD